MTQVCNHSMPLFLPQFLVLDDVSVLQDIDLEEGSLVYTRKSDELWLRGPNGWRQVMLGRKVGFF